MFSSASIRRIHYLSGAILIKNEGKADSLLYTYSDAQGSLIALTDADGGIVRRYAYDPWGKRRDASNWNITDNGANLIINRGYTGHEHLDAFGIINMNGRVYDPLTAQFFSPDPVLQTTEDWLNYNRYSYCINNPFKYTDKSGYWFGLDDLVAAGVGLIVGYVSYGITTGNWGWKALAAGGIGAAVAWVGWNTMGAGAAAMADIGGVGSAPTLSAGITAVLGTGGTGYGSQFAAYTFLNAQAHQSQLKAADEKGWGGVLMMGVFATSSVLSYSLNPLDLKAVTSFQKFAGVVLTDNISDNMKDGEFKLNSLHVGLVGYNFDKKNVYSVFDKDLSDDQRWDMGFETLLGLSLLEDVRVDYRGLVQNPGNNCGCHLSNVRSLFIGLSPIAKISQFALESLDSFYMLTQNETAFQYWFNKKYKEDGTPNY